MPEIQDSEFLQYLREYPVVSPEQVRSAQELQRDELDQQGSCRTLFAILCAKGLIDDRVARSLRPSSDGGKAAEVTPKSPTVVLPPPETDGSSELKRPGSHSSIASIRSARKRPPEVEAAAATPRNVLGPYILVREVGKGGMGRVYHAWDENVGRFVALKVIDTEDQGDRERFVREAQIAGRLSHPSIATVFHAGEVETRGYIAMQFIEGGPIDAQKLPLLTALALIRDAAHALAYAHEQGVVHRDVKPGNLMVDGKGHLFLTDFGLAKEVVGEAGTKLSITGTTFGTPQFMSPEQARGEHQKIDGRSDVYSLGATLYALLARRPPFTSKNLATLLLEVLDKTPPRLSRFNREISPELEMLVERSMSKDAGKRFPTMAAFAEALDRMIRDGRYAGRYGMVKAVARRWVPRLLAAGVLAVALWFGLPLLFAPPAPPPPEDPAPRLYGAAVTELRTLEGQNLEADVFRDRLKKGVFVPLGEVMRLKPGDLRARVARVRALYAQGDRDAATRELSALQRRRESDYRLVLVSALLALEKALEAPCPLPALEAPSFEWDRKPEPIAGIDPVWGAKVAPDLAEEYKEDAPMIQGLEALVLGDYAKAADGLAKKTLPVVKAARIRAAYLARRFDLLKDVKERREGFGARLALAVGSAAELEVLLPEAGTDGPALHAALARLEGAEAHVQGGLEGASPERRASLLSVRLRTQAAAWADAEKDYRAAMQLVGEAPSTWPGKLAAIELRLGLGARLLRSRADGKPLLEDALRRADDLAAKTPGWAPPRRLAATARLKLGRLDEARASTDEPLILAAVELAAAEREMRAGRPYVDLVKASQRAALKATRDHPQAQALLGRASMLLARQARVEEREESEFVIAAVDAFTKAEGLVEARYHRGQALFLLARFEEARGDADAVLAAAPDYPPARYLRANVNFSLGRDAEAVADWRALIQADPATYDTPDVRSWIDRALKRSKK